MRQKHHSNTSNVLPFSGRGGGDGARRPIEEVGREGDPAGLAFAEHAEVEPIRKAIPRLPVRDRRRADTEEPSGFRGAPEVVVYEFFDRHAAINSSSLNFVKRLEPELTHEGARFRMATMQIVEHKDPEGVDAIAERLDLTRRALGLRQNAFAARAGLNPNTYNQWEKAKGRPDIDGAKALCRTYDLSLDWIYFGNAGRLPADLIEKIVAQRSRRVA